GKPNPVIGRRNSESVRLPQKTIRRRRLSCARAWMSSSVAALYMAGCNRSRAADFSRHTIRGALLFARRSGLPQRLVDQGPRMTRPIQLHADLAIAPAREAEAIHYFETVYRPTASRCDGYVDLRLLRLQGALVGSAPAGINYRFSITFTTE